jgi:hypothetical protein
MSVVTLLALTQRQVKVKVKMKMMMKKMMQARGLSRTEREIKPKLLDLGGRVKEEGMASEDWSQFQESGWRSHHKQEQLR